ncbi:MAG: hypothetical protein ACI8WO_000191 [Methylophilaceae bacterium]|jgi:hypothetical protein|tara:strand:- start:268 stop:432 length:165 start_codon:yes stop_codon:yes gene_type:complete
MISPKEIKYLIASLAKNKYLLFFVKRKQPTIKARNIHRIKILSFINIIAIFLNS